MATFADSKGHNGANVRKALEMAILVKPWAADDVPVATIHGATGLVVPTGYVSVGMTTKDDGANWSRDEDSSDVMAHGYSEPIRRDITSSVSGLAFTAIESKRQTFELYHGVTLAGITTDAQGNVYFDRASRPNQPRYRVLAIGKDGDGADAIYMARWLPNAQVTETGEQSWTEGEEIRYPVTFTAYVDSVVGTSFREVWGGPGFNHVAAGFAAPA